MMAERNIFRYSIWQQQDEWSKTDMLGASHSIVSDCDTRDCSPPGFSVHGILQTKILEWVAIPFSEDLPEPGIMPKSSYYRQILYHLND